MDIALQIIQNKAEKIVWNKRDGSQRILNKSDLCPISKKWLIPANCTEVQPPEVEEGYKVCFKNGEWIIEKTEEQEVKEIQKSVVDILQDQISELKKQLEELKCEKEEVKNSIVDVRREALELSTNLILQKEELNIKQKGSDFIE